MLKVTDAKILLAGKAAAVDATTLEASAAMKAIRHKDSGDDWKESLTRLAAEADIEHRTDEDLRSFDRQHRGKKVSNDEWTSTADPDRRIAKMKDGTTHQAYKAKHVEDLNSNLVLATEVYHEDQTGRSTLQKSVLASQINLARAGSGTHIEDVAADKSYHKAQMPASCTEDGLRTYLPGPRRAKKRVWADKPAGWEEAFRGNRRRVRRARGKWMQRRRSEYAERMFMHVCETSGARRSWLRGMLDVSKRYLT